MFTETKAQANLPPLDLSGRTNAAGTPAYRKKQTIRTPALVHRCTSAQAERTSERSTDTKIYKHNNTSTWAGHNGILPRCRTSISAPRQKDKKHSSIRTDTQPSEMKPYKHANAQTTHPPDQQHSKTCRWLQACGHPFRHKGVQSNPHTGRRVRRQH